MKIAITATNAASFIDAFEPMLSRLKDAGHELHLAAPLPSDDTIARIEASGVEFAAAPMDFGVFNVLADISNLLHMKMIMVRIKPDLVFSTGFKAAILGSLAARMAWVGHKKQVYAHLPALDNLLDANGAPTGGLRGMIAKSMYRSGLRPCDGVMCAAQSDLDALNTLQLIPAHAQSAVVRETDDMLAFMGLASQGEE